MNHTTDTEKKKSFFRLLFVVYYPRTASIAGGC